MVQRSFPIGDIIWVLVGVFVGFVVHAIAPFGGTKGLIAFSLITACLFFVVSRIMRQRRATAARLRSHVASAIPYKPPTAVPAQNTSASFRPLQQPLQPLPPVVVPANVTAVRIFVSHSHKDEAVTMRLVGDLQRAGASVWVDVANLQSGDFMQRINTALGATDWVILVQTPNSLASPAVAMEVNAAINMTWKNQVRGVIPFIVAPCDPATIPPTWSTLHYYDATRDYPAALQQLLRAVGLTH